MQQTKIDIVIERLERIEDKQDELGDKIYDIHGKVSHLEAKASFFGMVGGAIVALIAAVKGGH